MITPLFHSLMKRDLWWLALILAIGAVLRLSHLDSIGYHQDQADLSTLVQDLIEGKSFPLLGIPSSARIPNSPMTVYVLVPLFLISTDPVVVTALIAILNLLGITLLWLIAYRYFHPTIALVAGLAYAVNPWAIGYSRSIWAQNYHTPIFLLGLLLGLLGFIEGKRWAQILCLPVLIIAIQIHLAAWAFLPIYGWLLWTGRRKTSWKILITSVIVSAITLLPYVLGAAAYFAETSAATVQPLERELTLRNLIKPYGQNLWLLTGLGIEQYAVRDKAEEFISYAGIPIVLWLSLGIFALLGIRDLWRCWPRSHSVLVLLWAFLPLAVLTIPFIDVAAHYFVPCIPAFTLLIAVGATHGIDLLNKYARHLRYAVWITLGVVFVSQAVFFLRLVEYSRSNYIPGQFGTSTPFTYLRQIQSLLADDKNIVILVSDSWLDWRATGRPVWASLLRDSATCVRELSQLHQALVLPKGSFTAVFAPNVPEFAAFTQLYRGNTEPIVVPLRPNEGEYRIYRFQEAPQWSAIELLDLVSTRFDNGLQLDGYAIAADSLWLRWTLPQAGSTNYRTMITSLDADGKLIDRRSLDFWPSANWCLGDRLIQLTNFSGMARTLQVSIETIGKNELIYVLQDGEVQAESVDIPVPAS